LFFAGMKPVKTGGLYGGRHQKIMQVWGSRSFAGFRLAGLAGATDRPERADSLCALPPGSP
jgi:hypothetical protein